jgi:hypothetical protein
VSFRTFAALRPGGDATELDALGIHSMLAPDSETAVRIDHEIDIDVLVCLSLWEGTWRAAKSAKEIRMARLTTAKKKAEPKSEFGLPGQRKYPMPDKSHARNAKARASQMEHQGKLSAADKKKIDTKADRILNK